MLMPRAHFANTIGPSGLAVAMQQHQQQQHIKQLLSTAAAGAGVVGDVDALLVPLQMPTTIGGAVLAGAAPPQSATEPAAVMAAVAPTLSQINVVLPPLRLEPRPERNLWRTDEIMQMLTIMQQTNAIDLLNDKSVRSEKVFRHIEELMHKCGYMKKSHVQIWTKWKFLKSTYTTSKRNGVLPKMIPPTVYELLHKMLAFGVGGGSECGTSNTSLDGDSSNGPTGGARLHIASVDGSSPLKVRQLEEDAADEENAFGMAHPIFGFRLGLVKQEPADAGYEPSEGKTNGTTSEHDISTRSSTPLPGSSIANMQFPTQVKEEIELDASQTSPNESEQSNNFSPNKSAFITPVRTSSTSTPTRMPTPTALSRDNSPKASAVGAILQLPPLRIAPFAKAPCEEDEAPARASLERSPPPLSMHPPTSRAARTDHTLTSNNTSISISGSNKQFLQQRKQQTPPIKAPPTHAPVATIHLSPAVTIEPCAFGKLQSPPRLKLVDARTQPYSPSTTSSHREELEAATSPSPPRPHFRHQPQARHETSSLPPYPDVAMTSQQARMNSAIQKQFALVAAAMQKKGNKRRANAGRGRAVGGPPRKQFRKILPLYRGEIDDGVDNLNVLFDSAAAMQRQSFLEHNGTPPMPPETPSPPPPSVTATAPPSPEPEPEYYRPNRREREFFDDALKDLGMSMREMQRELFTDFFKQQMEIAQKEHEFQMQQDMLLMRAFEQQTQQIMAAARELLGVTPPKRQGTNGHPDSGESEPKDGKDMNAEHEGNSTATTKTATQQDAEPNDERQHDKYDSEEQDYAHQSSTNVDLDAPLDDDSDSDSSGSSSSDDSDDSDDEDENGDGDPNYNGNDADSGDDDNTADSDDEDDDDPIQLVTSELKGED